MFQQFFRFRFLKCPAPLIKYSVKILKFSGSSWLINFLEFITTNILECLDYLWFLHFIKLLQAQPIASEVVSKLLGNRVAVSPIVTVEPRRRKFHKPITLTIPVPTTANKGMINQYSGDAPTLRLLCSITGNTYTLRLCWKVNLKPIISCF